MVRFPLLFPYTSSLIVVLVVKHMKMRECNYLVKSEPKHDP